jgi:uncharacterized protein YkwD
VRRRLVLLTLVVAVLVPPGTAQASPSTSRTALSPTEVALLRAVNGVRKAHGLHELRIDPALVRAARYQSRKLLARDVLDHGNLVGRLQRFGVKGSVLGENLAWGTETEARAGEIVRGWLASPHHRANLLRPGYQKIGLGAATGTFAGYTNSTVATADFVG